MRIEAAYDAWAATYDAHPNHTRDLDRAVSRRILAARRVGSLLEIGW